MRLYPSVLLPPLLLFALLCGLGVWGVLSAAQDHADDNRREALSVARDAVASFKVRRYHRPYTAVLIYGCHC